MNTNRRQFISFALAYGMAIKAPVLHVPAPVSKPKSLVIDSCTEVWELIIQRDIALLESLMPDLEEWCQRQRQSIKMFKHPYVFDIYGRRRQILDTGNSGVIK